VKRVTCPCRNCESRCIGCHANCKAYMEYDEYNKLINDIRLEEQVVKNFQFDIVFKTKKKYCGKKGRKRNGKRI